MSDEPRKHSRVEWVSSATIDLGDGRPGRPCIVSNLCNAGAKLSGVEALSLPDEFILRLSAGRGFERKCRVVWRKKHDLGVEFITPFPSAGKRPQLQPEPAVA
jgi:hypothetical protein